MKVINLFGPPGTGKSTIAAILFGLLKMRSLEVELVREFAKVLTWSERHVALQDQLYVLAEQHHRLFMLRDRGLDFAISDGPLFNSLVYSPENYFPSFEPLVLEAFSSFDNINIVLERTHPYSTIGRYHSEVEAEELNGRIETLLERHRVPIHARLKVSDSAPQTIMQFLLNDGDDLGRASPP